MSPSVAVSPIIEFAANDVSVSPKLAGFSNEISGIYTYLVIFFTIIFVFSLLAIFKHFYVKHRGTMRARSELPTPAGSFTADVSGRSSASFLPLWGTVKIGDGVTGYFVGFFGSPASETGIKENSNKITQKEHTILYCRSSQAQSFSLHDICSIEASINSDGASCANERRRSCLFCLPACPIKTQIGRSNFGRRDSLPSVYQADIQDLFHQKRRSISKHPEMSTSTIESGTVSPQVKFAEETNHELDVWTPLSPTLQCVMASYPPSPVPAHASHASNLIRKPVLPMHVLPVSSRSSLIPRPASHVPATSYISHPYALAQPYIPQCASVQDRSSQSFLPLSAHPQTRHTVDIWRPRQPSDSHFMDSRSSEVATPAAISSRPRSSFPPPVGFESVVRKTTRTTHKRKLSSVRAKQSPAIGPSPLRTMILPDVSTDTLIYPDLSSKGNAGAKGRSGTDGEYLNFGLELCQPVLEKHSRPDQDSSGREENHPNSSNRSEDGASDMLLGIIRELVEETKEWDASLFMDENFKSMLFKCAANDNNFNSKKSTRQSELELQADRRNEEPLKEQVNMISFWEEGLGDAHDHLENVGLAC